MAHSYTDNDYPHAWRNPLRHLPPIPKHPIIGYPYETNATDCLLDWQPKEQAHNGIGELFYYTPVDAKDDTTSFLRAFLRYLPKEGQDVLATEIVYLNRRPSIESPLVQLRDFLMAAVLLPMRVAGGQLPNDYDTMGDSCLRDYQLGDTLVSGAVQMDLSDSCQRRSGGLICEILRREERAICHRIIPLALGKSNKDDASLVRNKSIIWWALQRYFPGIRSVIQPDTVNQPGNAIMLGYSTARIFGSYELALQPLSLPNEYRLKVLEPPGRGINSEFLLPFPETITFAGEDVPPPHPALVEVYGCIGNILYDHDFAIRLKRILEMGCCRPGELYEYEEECLLDSWTDVLTPARPKGYTKLAAILDYQFLRGGLKEEYPDAVFGLGTRDMLLDQEELSDLERRYGIYRLIGLEVLEWREQ